MTRRSVARPSFGRSSSWAMLVVLHGLAAGEASAQEERWHTVPIEALPAGAVLDDLAFHDGVGYVAVRAGDGSGRVVRVHLPDDAGPVFDDAGFTGFSYGGPMQVSFHGTHVAVPTEFVSVAVLDVEGGAWDTAGRDLPFTAFSALLFEADAVGGARFLATPASTVGTQEILFHAGAGWVGHDLNDQDVILVALLSSPWTAAVGEDGQLHVAYDVTGLSEGEPWVTVGAVVPALPLADPVDASAARLDDGGLVAVAAHESGSWALHVSGLDEGDAVAEDCSEPVLAVAPSGFRRVASTGGVLYALDREGRVHRIADPGRCDGWALGTVSPSLFTGAVGIGALDEDSAVAVGNDASDGVPIFAWRNRPPVVAPVADLSLDEGASTTFPVSVDDPDPADVAFELNGSCEGLALDTAGLDVTLTAGPSASGCTPGDATVSCELWVSDGERAAGRSFVVDVRDVDGEVPPSPPALALDGDDVREVPIALNGVEETLTVTVTDTCADTNTVVWDLAALPEVLRPSGMSVVRTTSSDAAQRLALTAPLEDVLALDGQEATVIARVEGGEPGADEVRFELHFVRSTNVTNGAEIEVSLSAPAARALDLGDVVRVDATLSSMLPVALPSLRVTLSDGELAALDGTLEVSGSPCGASGSARSDEGRLRVEAEGVRAGCPLSFHFLARKGLAREPLRVVACSWGPDDEAIEPCGGALSITRERALGCAQPDGTSSGLLGGLLALTALGWRRRRRRRR